MKHPDYFFIVCITLLLLSCERPKPLPQNQELESLIAAGENPANDINFRINKIDSAFSIFQKYSNDSLTRMYYRRGALVYFETESLRKSIKLAKAVVQLSHEDNDSVSIKRASYLTGLSYYKLGIRDSALIYYQKAEPYYKASRDPDLGLVLLYKAYVLYDVGEYVFCETEAFKALRLLKEQNLNIDVYRCLVVIASTLKQQDNADEAIHYFRLAVEQINKFSNQEYSEADKETFRVICYHNIGSVYEKSRQYEKAIDQYNLALASPVTKDNDLIYARTLNSLAKARFYLGDKEDALSNYKKSLAISESINDKQGAVDTQISLAEYYQSVSDTITAVAYYRQAYIGAKQIDSNNDKLKTLKGLSDLDLGRSHYYSTIYISLNDSLQDIALQNRNKYARIEYETDQLQNQNDELLRKNSFIIGISVVVLLFVAAIFIIYYLNSRNKELILTQEQQKASEEIYQLMLEQQNKVEVARSEEKNRIAMELHDGILNNIYAVRLNLEFTNRKTDAETIEKRKEYIKELQSLEAEIRSVSHDLSRSANLVEGKDFGAMLYFMVISQKNNFNTEFDITIDKHIDWNTISNTLKVNIYRIVQEALQNINKYSQAAHAQVSISKIDDNQLLITVSDDGIGFDVKKAATGIGLKNLKKRTETLSGLFKIESEKGKGATVKVQLSIQ